MCTYMTQLRHGILCCSVSDLSFPYLCTFYRIAICNREQQGGLQMHFHSMHAVPLLVLSLDVIQQTRSAGLGTAMIGQPPAADH